MAASLSSTSCSALCTSTMTSSCSSASVNDQ
jgi:hypothetical protein